MQSYSTLKAVTTRATVSGLKPGTRYVFQVRARTSAGCGRFSQAMEVETGKPRECMEGEGQGAPLVRPRGGGQAGENLWPYQAVPTGPLFSLSNPVGFLQSGRPLLSLSEASSR